MRVSIWKPEEILAVRRMERIKYFSIWDPERNDFGQLHAHNPQLEGTQFKPEEKPDSYLNMDYEMHLEMKIDYLFFQSSRLLQATEIQLLQNQCEQERTKIPTNLMLALENTRLAGYMLTGN